jgi:hypothetical protein
VRRTSRMNSRRGELKWKSGEDWKNDDEKSLCKRNRNHHQKSESPFRKKSAVWNPWVELMQGIAG